MENKEGLIYFDMYKWFTLWDSGCTKFIIPYCKLNTKYKHIYPGDTTQVNGIGGLIKTQGIGTIILDLKDDTYKIRPINLEHFYFPRASKLLIRTNKWTCDRGEAKFGKKGTHLQVMGKYSILVWKNRTSFCTILHAPRCALPETSINQYQ